MNPVYNPSLVISFVAPQAVDHPYLVVYSRTTPSTGNIVDIENSEQMCGICNDPLDDPVVSYSFGCITLLLTTFLFVVCACNFVM